MHFDDDLFKGHKLAGRRRGVRTPSWQCMVSSAFLLMLVYTYWSPSTDTRTSHRGSNSRFERWLAWHALEPTRVDELLNEDARNLCDGEWLVNKTISACDEKDWDQNIFYRSIDEQQAAFGTLGAQLDYVRRIVQNTRLYFVGDSWLREQFVEMAHILSPQMWPDLAVEVGDREMQQCPKSNALAKHFQAYQGNFKFCNFQGEGGGAAGINVDLCGVDTAHNNGSYLDADHSLELFVRFKPFVWTPPVDDKVIGDLAHFRPAFVILDIGRWGETSWDQLKYLEGATAPWRNFTRQFHDLMSRFNTELHAQFVSRQTRLIILRDWARVRYDDDTGEKGGGTHTWPSCEQMLLMAPPGTVCMPLVNQYAPNNATSVKMYNSKLALEGVAQGHGHAGAIVRTQCAQLLLLISRALSAQRATSQYLMTEWWNSFNVGD